MRPSSERFVQAAYQIFVVEGLAQKSYRSSAERVASRLRFREGSDKDNGNAMPLGDEMTLQLIPDMPGICTSVIRQSVFSTAFESRNASADGNAAAE